MRIRPWSTVLARTRLGLLRGPIPSVGVWVKEAWPRRRSTYVLDFEEVPMLKGLIGVIMLLMLPGHGTIAYVVKLKGPLDIGEGAIMRALHRDCALLLLAERRLGCSLAHVSTAMRGPPPLEAPSVPGRACWRPWSPRADPPPQEAVVATRLGRALALTSTRRDAERAWNPATPMLRGRRGLPPALMMSATISLQENSALTSRWLAASRACNPRDAFSVPLPAAGPP